MSYNWLPTWQCEHVVGLEVLHGLENLRHEQAELAANTRGGLPPPRPAAGELHADADAGANVVLLGVLDDEFELAELLDHGQDVAPELGGQHAGLDELRVLEPVADDRHPVDTGPARGGREAQHGQELGLAAGLKPEVELDSQIGDLLADMALLIDLDRVHAGVAADIRLIGHGVVKGLADLAQAVLEDVVEAEQDGGMNPALLQTLNDLVQVDLAGGVLGWQHGDVPGVVHADVALAPVGNAVET
jgi:hypothetical protein